MVLRVLHLTRVLIWFGVKFGICSVRGRSNTFYGDCAIIVSLSGQWRSSQKILGGAEDTLKNIRLLNSHYNAFIVLGRLWTSTSFCRLNNHREPACSSQHYRQAR